MFRIAFALLFYRKVRKEGAKFARDFVVLSGTSSLEVVLRGLIIMQAVLAVEDISRKGAKPRRNTE